MSLTVSIFDEKPRLRALLDQLGRIEDPRDPRRIAHSLVEVLLLAACGTVAGCDDYESIAMWGKAHLTFLRRHLPHHYGVPGGRWLTILMNIHRSGCSTSERLWSLWRPGSKTARDCRPRWRLSAKSAARRF